MNYFPHVGLDILLGKVMKSVEQKGDEEIFFTLENGEVYRLFHGQSCCENVTIESVVGDLQDLVGEPILTAEEVTGETAQPVGWTPGEYSDSFTWTFYKFSTRKGYVDIRWFGESNGYYSEGVDFERVS